MVSFLCAHGWAVDVGLRIAGVPLGYKVGADDTDPFEIHERFRRPYPSQELQRIFRPSRQVGDWIRIVFFRDPAPDFPSGLSSTLHLLSTVLGIVGGDPVMRDRVAPAFCDGFMILQVSQRYYVEAFR